MSLEIPERIVTKFRTLSLERLERIQAVWQSFVQGADDPEAMRTMGRDLHTLKGDAKIVGFEDVHVLAQKLEELVAIAGEAQFHISEELDRVVTQALQLAGMLLRATPGEPVGVDVGAVLRAVEELVNRTSPRP